MTISAKVILASQLHERGSPIIWTLQLRYPRMVHAEFMTHRVFSRNASSSRAIPVKKMIEDIRLDPAMPVFWGRNQSGMQADVELTEAEIVLAKKQWREAAESAIEHAERLMALGVHKQLANRVLEPFSHINVIVTATEWDNFFLLRDHKDAQPEIRALARKMRAVMTDYAWDNKFNYVEPGEWHLPYIRASEQEFSDTIKMKISAARCARVSYMTHDGKPSTVEADVELYDRLIVSKPAHASPVEHQAVAIGRVEPEKSLLIDPYYPDFANFKGWRSQRSFLEANKDL